MQIRKATVSDQISEAAVVGVEMFNGYYELGFSARFLLWCEELINAKRKLTLSRFTLTISVLCHCAAVEVFQYLNLHPGLYILLGSADPTVGVGFVFNTMTRLQEAKKS